MFASESQWVCFTCSAIMRKTRIKSKKYKIRLPLSENQRLITVGHATFQRSLSPTQCDLLVKNRIPRFIT